MDRSTVTFRTKKGENKAQYLDLTFEFFGRESRWLTLGEVLYLLQNPDYSSVLPRQKFMARRF